MLNTNQTPQISPDIYTQKRDELLQILEPVAEYEELDMESKTAFKRSINKLQSESFEIALVGEFQGGKSSTFNAICDGRHISPMGIGIKTSACKISAQNIVDPDEDERAIIRWKTDDELILTLLDILKQQLPEDEYENIKIRDNDGHFVNISLDKPEDVRMLDGSLEKEWAVYKKSPANYDRDLSGKLDLLYVASLNMHFRNDPFIADLRKETRITSIEEMQTYVKFPQDWSDRWAGYSADRFKSEEIVFSFIADVHCYIHSPNLQRLGCVITDYPGLFAGPWDTKVAQEAMLQADAILYLLPGENAIGQKELHALSEIQRTLQFHKVFFAMNARASYEHLKRVIRPANVSTINNCLSDGTSEDGNVGARLVPEDISIFNALLAYNSKHFPLLQESERREWKKKIRMPMATFLNLDIEDDANQLNELLDHSEKISEASKYDELLDTIETMVVQKKACSLLYTTGVLPVNTALEELEGKLQKREENASEGYQNAEKEANEAKAALEEFKSESFQVVSEEIDKSELTDVLSDDFVREVYLERTGAIASNILDNIEVLMNDSKESLAYIISIIKQKTGFSSSNEEKFARIIKGYISESIEKECLPAAEGWLANVIQGNNRTYKSSVGSALRSIAREINNLWQNLILSTPEGVRSYFKGLEPSVCSGNAAAKIVNRFDGSGLLDEIQGSMLKMFLSNITAAIGGGVSTAIALYVAGFFIIAISPPGWIAFPVLAASLLAAIASGVKIADWFKEKFSKKIRSSLSTKLKPEIDNAFSRHEIRKELKRSGDKIAQEILLAHKKFFKDDLKRLSAGFKERYDETERDRKKSKAEQQKIAEDARRIRIDIEHYREPIVHFIEGIRPYFERSEQ